MGYDTMIYNFSFDRKAAFDWDKLRIKQKPAIEPRFDMQTGQTERQVLRQVCTYVHIV